MGNSFCQTLLMSTLRFLFQAFILHSRQSSFSFQAIFIEIRSKDPCGTPILLYSYVLKLWKCLSVPATELLALNTHYHIELF